MSLRSTARRAFAAALAVQFLGLGVQATAGTASAAFEVRAQVASDATGCRATATPVSLACGAPQTPTVLRPRPDMVGTLADGWLTYGYRNDAFDSVYAASLTTRLIRYRDWEYIETLVSW